MFNNKLYFLSPTLLQSCIISFRALIRKTLREGKEQINVLNEIEKMTLITINLRPIHLKD